MAKVIGPLLSLSASGSVARLLTARETARGAVMLSWSRPGLRNPSPPSAAQLANRAWYGSMVAAWRALALGERAAWDALAAPLQISGWNLFLRDGALLPPAGTLWDGGSTVWDGGSTVWD